MKKWKENFLFFCRNRTYLFFLVLTALGSYGFFVTHSSIGIDDTCYAYYFEDGLNVIIGRWFLFLLNRIFHVSDFSPFITDLAGVLILMLAVTVWCTLLRSICEDRVPLWGYVFFSCIFLSCPLISEVYPYYLHNGISTGYLCTAVSLCFFRDLAGITDKRGWKKTLPAALGMIFFLCTALGCYESFMIVWLLGILLVLLTLLYMGQDCRVFPLLGTGAAGAAASLLLRSLMITVLTLAYNLKELPGYSEPRSIGEMSAWISAGAFPQFAMAVKRFYVMYFAFAYAYYPIRIFVAASLFLALYGIWSAFYRKKPWIAVLTFGCFVACFLLVFVEGKVTLYRSAQFLPVICGYGTFLASHGAHRLKSLRLPKTFPAAGQFRKFFPGTVTALLVFALSAVLWNQCYDMNRWFYVDWQKYQATVNTMEQVAFVLEREHDTSKPLVFTGTYQPPKGIIGDAYVEYGTKTFYQINRLTQPVDAHLLEKFYREYGVWVAQMPSLSLIGWGMNAFETDEELVRFLAMHGHDFQANTDPALYESACQYSVELPRFPAEGSIVDMGDYIIVHF